MSARCSPTLLLFNILAAVSTMAGSPALADAVPSVRPTWAIGDWWVVRSQVYDRGDKKAGAVPGWLAEETWLFSVLSTNSIDGEACYQVSIQPKDQNPCPYRFSCWFRMSDLLVLRRELLQPEATRTGRPFSTPVVQVNYSRDEEGPFVASDFPSLPLTMPHFAGGMTNVYRAKAYPAPREAAPRAARSAAGSVTQAFHPNETMANESPVGSTGLMTAPAAGTPGKSGVFVLSQSAERFERQSWNSSLPWHLYGERWEGGLLVRRSCLADHGHATGSPVEAPAGGGK
jgi:hypothetical protein